MSECIGEKCRCLDNVGHGPRDADRMAQLEVSERTLARDFATAVEKLNAERAAHERTKAFWAEQKAMIDAELAELKARADKAEAEAAAMREAVIARAEQGRREYEEARDARGVSVSDYYVVAMRALFLKFDAGRALAARVPLLEAVAMKARLHHCGGDCGICRALAVLMRLETMTDSRKSCLATTRC